MAIEIGWIGQIESKYGEDAAYRSAKLLIHSIRSKSKIMAAIDLHGKRAIEIFVSVSKKRYAAKYSVSLAAELMLGFKKGIDVLEKSPEKSIQLIRKFKDNEGDVKTMVSLLAKVKPDQFAYLNNPRLVRDSVQVLSKFGLDGHNAIKAIPQESIAAIAKWGTPALKIVQLYGKTGIDAINSSSFPHFLKLVKEHRIRLTKGDPHAILNYRRGEKSKKPGYFNFSAGYYRKENTPHRLAFAINSLSMHYWAEKRGIKIAQKRENTVKENEHISNILVGPNLNHLKPPSKLNSRKQISEHGKPISTVFA
ncbi:hypothetical protein HY989_00590 [Candidatus Micrarchaeota archaeon]|nr:hypothetical protein [Candidatus Micrarchaeota archaeon]